MLLTQTLKSSGGEKMASKKTRLTEKITRKVKELNSLMKEAHNMGLEIRAILDIKLLPFPLLDVRLFKEVTKHLD